MLALKAFLKNPVCEKENIIMFLLYWQSDVVTQKHANNHVVDNPSWGRAMTELQQLATNLAPPAPPFLTAQIKWLQLPFWLNVSNKTNCRLCNVHAAQSHLPRCAILMLHLPSSHWPHVRWEQRRTAACSGEKPAALLAGSSERQDPIWRGLVRFYWMPLLCGSETGKADRKKEPRN